MCGGILESSMAFVDVCIARSTKIALDLMMSARRLSLIRSHDYILSRQKVSCAVVAQPGRALDLKIWGEAEDRAVVSSNLTDGIFNFTDLLYHGRFTAYCK